jgi:hypothetical protein
MSRKIDGKELDSIYDELLAKMEQSKKDIFIISEQSRQGYEEIGEVAVGPIRERVFFHPCPVSSISPTA